MRMVGKPRVPRPPRKIVDKLRGPKEAPEAERVSRRNKWRGVYHPDARPCTDSAGPFIKAYALEGVIEFAFKFVNKTMNSPGGRLPGRSATKTLTYNAPYDGAAPHFIALRSFSGKFVTDDGKLIDRPLGAFEVDVRIEEPGLLACTVRLSDRNSDDPVELSVSGVIVFFQ